MSCFKASRSIRARRRGAVAILILLLMIFLIGCAAFALDLGYLSMARAELQRSADAGAMAGAWEMMDQAVLGESTGAATQNARQKAVAVAGQNQVCARQPAVDLNSANSPNGDV